MSTSEKTYTAAQLQTAITTARKRAAECSRNTDDLDLFAKTVQALIENPASVYPYQESADHVATWAVAERATSPLPTAGSVLLAALAEHGITAHTDGMSPSYAIPLDPATPVLEVYNRPHLSVADRSPSIEHDPATHTGWIVFLHDENGEPVGEPIYIAGNGQTVDCTADSVAAAAIIAARLASTNADHTTR